MTEHILKIADLTVKHGDKTVIDELSLSVAQGEIIALLGASGCGKTTTLKAVAGVLKPHSGDIYINNKCVNTAKRYIAPEKRHVGMIFQDYALFPHLNIAENIMFAKPKLAKGEVKLRAENWLEQVGLSGLADRFPHQLSGGQQQRVAVARALASDPILMLMDEPFSNIDAQVRLQLATDVRRILKAKNVGAVLVTHSREEAFAVADKIAVMDQGKVVQFGTPETIYHYPVSRFVASFMGEGSFVSLEKSPLGWTTPLLPEQLFSHQIHMPEAQLYLRPHQVKLVNGGDGVIEDVRFLGGLIRVEVRINDMTILVDAKGHKRYKVGDKIGVALLDGDVTILPV